MVGTFCLFSLVTVKKMKVRIPVSELQKRFPKIKFPSNLIDAVFDKAEPIDNKRSLKQNKSLYLYCTQLANMFNDAGLDMKAVLKPTWFISWTKYTVLDNMWRPIQKALFNTTSTKQLTKLDGEIDQIHDTINKMLANNPKTEHLPHLPFPHEEKPDTSNVEYEERTQDPKF